MTFSFDNKISTMFFTYLNGIVIAMDMMPLLPISNCKELKYENVYVTSSAKARVICDVICEKGPYCGTNIIGPDQTPRMMRGV